MAGKIGHSPPFVNFRDSSRPFESDRPMQLIEVLLAALIAGTLDTVAGFGGALLLLPVLVLVTGAETAVMLTAIISLGWNIVRAVVLREFVDLRASWMMVIGIVPGSLLGAAFLKDVDPSMLRTAIGAMLVIFGAYYVVRLYVELPEPRGMKRWMLPAAGFVSGVISTLLGAGHGPLQTIPLAAADLAPRAVTATNGVLGALSGLVRVGTYAFYGMLGSNLWVPGAVGLVGAGTGSLLGIRISRSAKDSTLELLIGLALLLAGVRLLF